LTKRNNIEDIKIEFTKRNYALLDNEYKNNSQKLKYICLKHEDNGIQSISYRSFSRGSGCKYCGKESMANKQRLNLKYIENELYKKDLILLSDFYVDAHTLLKFKCIHHLDIIQELSYNTIQQGRGCKWCSRENLSKQRRLSYDFVHNNFKKRGYELITDNYVNSNQKLQYICKKHSNEIQEITYDSFSRGSGCRFCGYEKIKDKQKGNKSRFWKGGITSLNIYLRKSSFLNQWKIDSAKLSDFKCVITGNKFEAIHHLYSFSNIVSETLNNLNYPICVNIGDYSDKELRNIEEECLRLHYKYGMGVCLSKDLHIEFHKLYGKGNNTPEQFEEFKKMKLNEYNNKEGIVA